MFAAFLALISGTMTFGVKIEVPQTDVGLEQVLHSLQAATSLGAAQCGAALDQLLSTDYVEIAPDGSVISRSNFLKAKSTACSGAGPVGVEDERIHLFKDASGSNKTAVITYRTNQNHGASYTQNLNVFSKRSNWVPIAGREMPVTASDQLAVVVDAKAKIATAHVGPNADTEELQKWVELSEWASVPSPTGSDEERKKQEARLKMMPADYLRITRTGNFMTRDEALNGGVDQAGVQEITYNNVQIAVTGDVGIVTYRSTYLISTRTQYNLVMRVFMKRYDMWDEIAGQSFPIPRPPAP